MIAWKHVTRSFSVLSVTQEASMYLTHCLYNTDRSISLSAAGSNTLDNWLETIEIDRCPPEGRKYEVHFSQYLNTCNYRLCIYMLYKG